MLTHKGADPDFETPFVSSNTVETEKLTHLTQRRRSGHRARGQATQNREPLWKPREEGRRRQRVSKRLRAWRWQMEARPGLTTPLYYRPFRSRVILMGALAGGWGRGAKREAGKLSVTPGPALPSAIVSVYYSESSLPFAEMVKHLGRKGVQIL